jgi:hypothetical protein
VRCEGHLVNDVVFRRRKEEPMEHSFSTDKKS